MNTAAIICYVALTAVVAAGQDVTADWRMEDQTAHVISVGESKEDQGNISGTMYPHIYGHADYANRLAAALEQVRLLMANRIFDINEMGPLIAVTSRL